MSSDPANLAAKGAAALSSQDYPAAISHYTQAIAAIPTSVDYYTKRSTANQRAGNHAAALSDAEIAVVLAQRKGNREQLSTAQLRRGISLLLMERYGDAGACLALAQKYNDKEKSIPFWLKKLEMELANIDEDDVRREVTVKDIPDVDIPKPASSTTKQATKPPSGGDSGRIEELPDDYEPPAETGSLDKGKGKAVEDPKPQAAAAAAAPPPPPPQGVTTPADKIRHEWYQTNTSVTVSLFVKGVPKDEAHVELDDSSLSITFPLPTGSDFSFTLDPLAHPINPSTSTHKILGTKVDFILQKAEPGRKWATLESTEAPSKTAATATPSATTTIPPPPKPVDKPPAYPTSSRSGPKNWDKLVNDLAANSKAKKSKDPSAPPAASSTTTAAATTTADDDIDYADLDDDTTADPVNGFFRKLYKDADPDTQRAMMKSYVESNGTALSTNWADVKKGKVETSPPDGMEAKQW
ncbi:hypothetical protein DRE_00445 [Drechslerella stenobrocha 248]|uniref:SGS-domain-containing protein n=1 Tax=Drechslerella stenobrocha 248 TaxID=1043628 RepID=W7I4Z0_9PEZI|nr:hypothetical protein DRE_00445 [Drechslerella stenobrocha 248]